MLSEYGPSLRLPHSRAFGDGLFELRPRGRAGIGRAFYCFMVGKRVVVLHAFIKKAQQTPDRELKLARVNGDLKLTHFSLDQRFKTDTPPIHSCARQSLLKSGPKAQAEGGFAAQRSIESTSFHGENHAGLTLMLEPVTFARDWHDARVV